MHPNRRNRVFNICKLTKRKSTNSGYYHSINFFLARFRFHSDNKVLSIWFHVHTLTLLSIVKFSSIITCFTAAFLWQIVFQKSYKLNLFTFLNLSILFDYPTFSYSYLVHDALSEQGWSPLTKLCSTEALGVIRMKV